MQGVATAGAQWRQCASAPRSAPLSGPGPLHSGPMPQLSGHKPQQSGGRATPPPLRAPPLSRSRGQLGLERRDAVEQRGRRAAHLRVPRGERGGERGQHCGGDGVPLAPAPRDFCVVLSIRMLRHR